MTTQKVKPLFDIYKTQTTEPIPNHWDWILRSIIIFSLLLVVYLNFSGRVFQPLFNLAKASDWTRFIIRPSLMWGIMGLMLLIFRTFLWMRYKPFPSVMFDSAPSLTVIIPAYNEGNMVEKSIDSVATALYPLDKLEIFVVDDGSKDDTWQYIQSAAKRYPGLVTTIRFSENRGKRAALEAGFRQAKGEIAVTIDSDSVIERNTLLAIAGPFADPNVGAVAGKVLVYNKYDGLVPRMLHVRYMLSFDFLRAAQSTYGTVYCCPGALSAYRVSVVKELLDKWVKQTFLGELCTYGEDRALTNYVLLHGYDTVYQRTAVVKTIVPVKYIKLSKMYLRWDRSYIKEEFRFVRIVWKRRPLPRLIAIIDAFITNMRYPVSYAILALLVIMSVNDPATILRLLFAIGFMSFLNTLYYLRSERSWDFIYGVFYSYYAFFTLFWIFPYAAITLRARSWMTR